MASVSCFSRRDGHRSSGGLPEVCLAKIGKYLSGEFAHLYLVVFRHAVPISQKEGADTPRSDRVTVAKHPAQGADKRTAAPPLKEP